MGTRRRTSGGRLGAVEHCPRRAGPSPLRGWGELGGGEFDRVPSRALLAALPRFSFRCSYHGDVARGGLVGTAREVTTLRPGADALGDDAGRFRNVSRIERASNRRQRTHTKTALPSDCERHDFLASALSPSAPLEVARVVAKVPHRSRFPSPIGSGRPPAGSRQGRIGRTT